MAHRDRTGCLRWSDSNSETSSQNIPLKGRSDCPDPAEFWPQRLFALELRRPGDAARPRARTSAGVLARTLVIELPSLRWQELPRFFCRFRDDPAAAHPATPLLTWRWTFPAKRACVVVTDSEPERLAPLPRQRPVGLRGGWVVAARCCAGTIERSVACPSANAGQPPRRRLHPKFGRRQPAAAGTPGGRIRSRGGGRGFWARRGGATLPTTQNS